jgi:hypothetical protein
VFLLLFPLSLEFQLRALTYVHSEMVDVGSGQGRTTGCVLRVTRFEFRVTGCGQYFTVSFESENSVRSEMADFGSGQGRSVFAPTGVVFLRRGLQKSENADLGQ